ncbi:hypothetical protein Mapa_000709 [Marchantia paleacea]|nr:hypothetical protein Mapa_000709 [Marchantia paleacea]
MHSSAHVSKSRNPVALGPCPDLRYEALASASTTVLTKAANAPPWGRASSDGRADVVAHAAVATVAGDVDTSRGSAAAGPAEEAAESTATAVQFVRADIRAHSCAAIRPPGSRLRAQGPVRSAGAVPGKRWGRRRIFLLWWWGRRRPVRVNGRR